MSNRIMAAWSDILHHPQPRLGFVCACLVKVSGEVVVLVSVHISLGLWVEIFSGYSFRDYLVRLKVRPVHQRICNIVKINVGGSVVHVIVMLVILGT